MALVAGRRGFWASSQLEIVDGNIDGFTYVGLVDNGNTAAKLVNAVVCSSLRAPMRVQFVGPTDQLVLSSCHAASVALGMSQRGVEEVTGLSASAIKI